MTDLTPLLDELLQKHNTRLKHSPRKSSDTRDEFLKEAYRINNHILSLHTYLLSIRPAYLSTSPVPRRHHHHHHPNASTTKTPPTHLTNPDRDAIDASSKTVLRDLNASLRQLSQAECVRRACQARFLARKFSKGGMARWAAGGGAGEKSAEEEREEERLGAEGVWRDGVVWFLGRGLEGVGEVQRGMMERRLEREVERGRSVLYRIKGTGGVEGLGGEEEAGGRGRGASGGGYKGGRGPAVVVDEEEERREVERQLSPEQLQLFARENQDMLRRYEDTLDQVRTADRSMLEISELQTTLVQNLDIQSANVSQLVADSLSTTENVGGGNKELKRATERKSTARMVFWASCGLCGFLITWDLIF